VLKISDQDCLMFEKVLIKLVIGGELFTAILTLFGFKVNLV
jgi:hypothetical protein